MAEELKRSAAYIPWATFKNALEQLAQGVPSRIDRSVFPGIAWNVQTQLFAGMKFLGLLKGEDQPTATLDDLVKGSEEERKAKLKKVIEDSYADLIAIDLTKATRAHFEEKLGELYSVTGDTRVKAVRFFLSAATYVGIPLSAFIRPAGDGNGGSAKRVKSATPRSRTATPRAARTPTPPPPPVVDPAKPAGESRSVSLASGGVLTLSATANFLSLSSADRTFVFDLIDKLEEYGKKVSS